MAACNLTLELDEPSKVYASGEKIRGQVKVRVEKDVHCKGLRVATEWSTHGRGNVDSGTVDSTEVFSGDWRAGQEYSYAFELVTAQWPPTYYGTYLNVSHQLTARAMIPWSTDPKANIEFPLVAKQSPQSVAPTRGETKGQWGLVGWLIGGVLLLLFGFLFLFLVPVILVIVGLGWFFTSYLPKSVTGEVDCQIEPARLQPGQTVRGWIEFEPKRKSRINGVRSTVQCLEVCVSGSGSNRKTHQHEVCKQTFPLLEAEELLPGKRQRLEFEYTVPDDSPPSLDLNDNDVKWQVEMRVDIPRWPDYAKTIEFIVEPSAQGRLGRGPQGSDSPARAQSWWQQVVEQMYGSEDDPQRLSIVLEAIRDHAFDEPLEILGPAAPPSEAADIQGGQWLECEDGAGECVLLHCGDDVDPPTFHSTWRGRFRVIGYRSESGEVIVQAVPAVPTE